jgi:NitT/TauT family transport system ATP-binding protein
MKFWKVLKRKAKQGQKMQQDKWACLMDKIVVSHVTKHFKTKTQVIHALEDVSMTVKEGEFVCLVGPSGCGKTTLLNLIAGFEFPEKGEVLVDGKVVESPGSDRMVMFQESALFPWLSAYNNILFSLKLKPTMTPEEQQDKALFFLRLVGLEKFAQAHPHQLSGGMKQRVALARALAPDPRVLLMDEPFAALDALTREQLYEDLQLIWLNQQKTVVFVTHNVAEAICLGDHVLLFSSHPGKIFKEVFVPLARPREIRSVEVAQLAGEITHVLRTHLLAKDDA